MSIARFRLSVATLVFLAATVNARGADEPAGGPTETTRFINEYFAKVWKDNKLTPSARCNDFEFVRRVHLDLIGRIPTADEVRKFVSNPNRAKLVHELLHGKDYADAYARHMANVWTVWTLTRTSNPTYREQMHLWLETQFAKNASYRDMAIQLITATGKTNDNGAVNFILAHLGERAPDGKVAEDGHFEMIPITSRTTRLFLGLQTQCVQCHDHPFNPEWKQNNFWGVNAFYRQVNRAGNPIMRQDNRNMTAAILELTDDPEVHKDGIVYYERRNGMILPTSLTFLDGRKAELTGTKTRRELLAEMTVTHELFPKAMVNRMWGMLFGRGLNEQPAVDDFGEHNKVVHPELLDRIAKDFAYNNAFDLKDLLTAICNSDPYQRTSVANSTNDKPETDVFFSRMQLKAMTPEQLLESLWVATQGKPASSFGDAKEVEKRRAEWTAKLVRNFGDDEGNEITFNGTVVQALLMMNGKEINAEIVREGGVVFKAVNRPNPTKGRVIGEIYMAALGRPVQGNEMSVIDRVANRYGGQVDRTFYADVMWALLNSNEFILNH